MFKTSFGAFDGTSWEALCQQVFKRRYAQDGYQHIPATPGDFGLEGFCAATGIGFQCYCPNKHYTHKELYEHQRSKITTDLNKLKNYQNQIASMLADTKLSVWRFVTPKIANNRLINHARIKEKEVRKWRLSFLSSKFSIELNDADYYSIEINEIRTATGESIDFNIEPAILTALLESPEIYEKNIQRKTLIRLTAKSNLSKHPVLVAWLHQQTLNSFLESDGYFRQIEKDAPVLYLKVVSSINEFEHYVQEQAAAYVGTPQELTEKIRQRLEDRLIKLTPKMSDTTAAKISRLMVTRWLAICSLDYD